MNNLIYDLQSFSLSQRLDALCDGSFLSGYAVTESQVEDLYNLITEEIEAL